MYMPKALLLKTIPTKAAEANITDIKSIIPYLSLMFIKFDFECRIFVKDKE
jgi:hypothetical protein